MTNDDGIRLVHTISFRGICSEFWFYHNQEFMFTNNSKKSKKKTFCRFNYSINIQSIPKKK